MNLHIANDNRVIVRYRYYTEFPIYNPYLDNITHPRLGQRKAGVNKLFDVDGVTNINVSYKFQRLQYIQRSIIRTCVCVLPITHPVTRTKYL